MSSRIQTEQARARIARGEMKCDCGSAAYRLKWGEPVCRRCDEIEIEMSGDKAACKYEFNPATGQRVNATA